MADDLRGLAEREQPMPIQSTEVDVWRVVIAEIEGMPDEMLEGILEGRGISNILQAILQVMLTLVVSAMYREVDDVSIQEIRATVIAMCHSRRELGIQRYGVPLSINNGRDMLADAIQEALDLLVYTQAYSIEEQQYEPAEDEEGQEADDSSDGY